MGSRVQYYITSVLLLALTWSCTKNKTGEEKPYVLSYGDSIFYVNPDLGSDFVIRPTEVRPGTYIGFPDGVEIDDDDGSIKINNSESGLRYKITHISPEGDSTSTLIVISGLNFLDKIYNLSNNDTLAIPIYNANGQAYQPGLFGTGTNNTFDDGNWCNGAGCAVSLANGSINLAQSMRNGALTTLNDDQKEFTYYYRMDDPSQKKLNKLKIKLYYYATQADIPQYLWDILLIDHAGTILRTRGQQRTGGTDRLARPRPPCIIIVGQ